MPRRCRWVNRSQRRGAKRGRLGLRPHRTGNHRTSRYLGAVPGSRLESRTDEPGEGATEAPAGLQPVAVPQQHRPRHRRDLQSLED